MRVYKKVTEEVTKEKLVRLVCDWCGEDARLDSSIVNDEEFELRFSAHSGTGIYLSSGGWEVEDLCKGCIDRLRSLLEENGITVREFWH